ncbi:kinesin-associated protein 3-like [Oppia nitens]|uniref:kinesin-associated protein 3-like n=1 Tax=Oppia nitens TaxID=1686743 RepID=UPI0023DAF4F1|nr:kinesin-associated protein 3-like [Oppia nitens]
MDLDDLNCIQRHLRTNSIDVHPTEKAIIINYELEASLVGDLGDTMLEESRQLQKIIRVKNLDEWTDIKQLAKELIEKCDLIPASKYNELTTLLHYLQTRKEVATTRPQTALSDRMKNMLIDRPDSETRDTTEEAVIDKLDHYIELLYEDLPEKIKGSLLILKLSKNSENLIELTTNETLVCALARVLREDGKKSLELAINIVFIFACFSNYSQFHITISQFKVGSICFDLVECELTREDSWIQELNEKKALAEGHYNLTAQADFEKSLKRYQLLIRKQNNLLRVVYYLLLNLSEDTKVEIKMVNKGIIRLLVKTLDRDSQELLLVVVLFLKKLSIYIENKNQMKELSIIEKLAPVLSLTNENLVSNTLKLMHNLIFDNQLRVVVIKTGLILKLVTFLSKDKHTKTVLTILYQISRNDKWKTLFSYSSECIHLIVSKVLNPTPNTYNEIISLAINLALNQRNAQLMCDNSYLNELFVKCFETKDPLLLKLLRNISHHDDPIKMLFIDYHKQLIEIMVNETKEEIIVECLAIISNLTLTQIDWYSLFIEYNLFEWIYERIKVGNTTDDDIILQLAIFIGTAVNQRECCLCLMDNKIIQLLIDLLNAKQKDDEIVIQIIYAFYMFVRHSEARDVIVKDSQVAPYLIDLMHDRNKDIKRICDATLDVIAECDLDLASKIKEEKFCSHNKQWLEMIESQACDTIDQLNNGLDESLIYPELLIKTDLLNDSSSDNLSDEHSIQQSMQAMSLSIDGSDEPVFVSTKKHDIIPALVTTAIKRPQTGYKNRSSTATARVNN